MRKAGTVRLVPFLIGFCILIKRPAADRIGPLDTRFSIGGYEDFDYCLRLRRAGYRLLFCDDVYVHHYGQRSFEANGLDETRWRERNRKIFKRKWSDAP
jgi:GT2 family glycosyltransferase